MALQSENQEVLLEGGTKLSGNRFALLLFQADATRRNLTHKGRLKKIKGVEVSYFEVERIFRGNLLKKYVTTKSVLAGEW